MGVRGSCLCRDVAFEVDAPFESMGHCSMCRKAHGAAFQTYAMTQTKGLRWLGGSERVRRYASSAGGSRAFCGRCGSVVPDPRHAGESIGIPAGLLDDDPGIRPELHLMVGSKAPWHEVADSLAHHDVYPPGWGDGIDYARPTQPAPGAVRGSCLCGSVAYEIAGQVAGPIVNCHCSRCRKARSAAHASNLFVDLARFRWLRGEELVESYKVPEAQRFTNVFCRTCGSCVPRTDPSRGIAVVPAGSLDDDPGAREELHIFVGSKAPWYEISDALPRHRESAPGTHPPPSRR